MGNEVKTIFTGDPAQLFRVADQVEQRLKALQSRTVSAQPIPPASAAAAFSQPAMASRSIQAVSVQTAAIKDFEIVSAKATETTKKFTAAEAQQELQMKRTAIAARHAADAVKLQEQSAAARTVFEQRQLGTSAPVPVRNSRAGQLDPRTIASRAQNNSAESIVRQFAPPEADMAADIAKSIGVSGAGLLVAGGVAAAGFAVIKFSEGIKERAEARLKVEEKFQGIYNDQATALGKVISQYKDLNGITLTQVSNTQLALRLIQQTRVSQGFGFGAGGAQTLEQFVAPDRALRDFNERVERSKNSVTDLQLIIDNLSNTRFENIDPGKQRGELLKEVILLQDQARKTGFTDADIAASKKASEERAEAERKRQAEFLEGVEKGKTKIKELASTWTATFRDLSAQAASDNLIARIFLDSQKALDDLKEKLKGLPQNMQAAAIQSQQSFNANQLFGARADNRMEAFDLRELAAKFRDDSKQRREFSQGGLDRDIADLNRQLGMGVNINVQANIDYLNRRQRLINGMTGDTPQSKLDRQFAELDKLNPANAQQRAILDERTLRLAGGLNPDDLRGDQRERIAQTAERRAEGKASQEQNAFKMLTEQTNYQKNISEYIDKLKVANEKEGIKGVNAAVEVTIKDETKSGVGVQSRPEAPSQATTLNLYSGSGGLTNR